MVHGDLGGLFKAANAGHPQIHKHHVRSVTRYRIDRLLAVGGRCRSIAMPIPSGGPSILSRRPFAVATVERVIEHHRGAEQHELADHAG